jgi:hypothetical protein
MLPPFSRERDRCALGEQWDVGLDPIELALGDEARGTFRHGRNMTRRTDRRKT